MTDQEHRQAGGGAGDWCAACGKTWPCEVKRLRAALDDMWLEHRTSHQGCHQASLHQDGLDMIRPLVSRSVWGTYDQMRGISCLQCGRLWADHPWSDHPEGANQVATRVTSSSAIPSHLRRVPVRCGRCGRMEGESHADDCSGIGIVVGEWASLPTTDRPPARGAADFLADPFDPTWEDRR